MNSSIHPILQACITIAPIFNDLFVEDISLSIQDRERILRYIPGRTIDLKIKEGDLLKSGSVSYEVIQTGRKIMRMVGREVHGVPYIAVGYPIFDDNQCVGCITTITSIDKQEQMMEMAEHLSSSLEEFSASMDAVVSTSDHLHGLNELIDKQVSEVSVSVEQTTNIIKFVNQVTQQTNILGLNASIEAARAGISGKGFSVVALEIRRLADSSASSSKNIQKELKHISRQLELLTEMNKEIFSASKDLTDTMSGLPEMIHSLRTMAETLSSFADVRVK